MNKNYDFSGYVTRTNVKCSDGRVILRDAFKDNNGTKVPLVYQHVHDDPENVIGHAVLENREDGVYGYGYFNANPKALATKEAIRHGDITSLSIYANKLKQSGENVLHGVIREVSVVMAGANPGAYIDNICFAHSDGTSVVSEEEAVIYSGEELTVLEHAEEEPKAVDEKEEKTVADKDQTVNEVWDTLSEKQKNVVYYIIARETGEIEDDEDEDVSRADDGGETIQDVWDSMTEKQKQVAYAVIGATLDEKEDEEDVEHSDNEGETFMYHNVFDAEEEKTLSHAEIQAVFDDAKRMGSLKDAYLEHGIEAIDTLFPDARAVITQPELIARPQEWVSKVWNATRKSPFARIKSVAADLTADDARARGYIKGRQKVEEQFKLLKRITTPQTVYKLQKLDRDDVIDIVDFDVVVWMKAEMRMMLNEELSRAILVGDGRSVASNDKIQETNIRPIYQDDDVYTIHKAVTYAADADETDISNALVDAALRSRENYMGSGLPSFYATVGVINDMLLAKDKMGRRLYSTVTELADALRVKEIVEVPVMEGVTRTDDDSKTYDLLGLIVNMSDYTIGADKGGAVNLFDDFDLNFNKYEYLIETRCSGALTKPYSAIALEKEHTAAQG